MNAESEPFPTYSYDLCSLVAAAEKWDEAVGRNSFGDRCRKRKKKGKKLTHARRKFKKKRSFCLVRAAHILLSVKALA